MRAVAVSRRVRARAVVGLTGVGLLASVARADAPGDQYGLFSGNSVTIYDTYTRLTWQRDTQLQTMTFDEAAAHCASLSLGSLPSGWRVPSYKELLTIVDEAPHVDYLDWPYVPKAIDRNAFPDSSPDSTPVDAPYWTSSISPPPSPKAYAVNFQDGTATVQQLNYLAYARCVHD